MSTLSEPAPISIRSLLQRLRPASVILPHVSADEIALALSKVFTSQLSQVETAILLYNLSITGLEQRPDVLAKSALAMRAAAVPLDLVRLRWKEHSMLQRVGNYYGGLCDIVGTGGDYHSTFNVSTTSSILCSSLLRIAKHGNRASTSKSGSADILAAMKFPHPDSPSGSISPRLEAVTPTSFEGFCDRTNYVYLFAPNFHSGLGAVATLRKELPNPTILNLLGPLTNPAESVLEARVIGVKKRELVPVFAEALRLNGVRKALVVCGAEDLDEISIAGPTHCARLIDVREGQQTQPIGTYDDSHRPEISSVAVETFVLNPEDFGVSRHPLTSVSPGKLPKENAIILKRLLNGELEDENPILHFVLINAAALFVVSGVCEGSRSPFADCGDRGDPILERSVQGGRWKEGVRLARLAIQTGKAMKMFKEFTAVTNGL